MPPTFLQKGSIVPQKWMSAEEKTRLSSETAIEWIINYLAARSWLNNSTPPAVKIKGIGSRVGVFRAATGTGKSTVMPAAIYNKFFEGLGVHKTIICTQPTVTTAVSIPYQITLFNHNMVLGKSIGYQTGTLIRKPIKGVLFATIGILLQHLKILTDDEFMKKYSFIILDEIHNRSIETDSTLFYLKSLLSRCYDQPECPFIILTSGTFEPKVFMDYFECPPSSFLDIKGSSFPIDVNFAKFDVLNCLEYAIDLAEKIHVENTADITEDKWSRDILIFTAGGGDIKKVIAAMHLLNATVFSKGLKFARGHSKERSGRHGGADPTYYVCPIAISSDSLQEGSDDYKNYGSEVQYIKVPIYAVVNGQCTADIVEYVTPSRKIYAGTNAVETGETIARLGYCIDTGMVNESQYNPNFGCSTLMLKNVTQASSRQRCGRVGRLAPGTFYTCYTKATHDSMQPMPFPNIISSDISSFLLSVIISETGAIIERCDPLRKNQAGALVIDPAAFQMNAHDQWWWRINYKKQFVAQELSFIQYPSADSISHSLEKLYGLGFIDYEYKPTLFGMYAAKFRKMSLENARMLLAGYHHGANILDLITIICFLQIGHKLGIKHEKYKPVDVRKRGAADATQNYTRVYCDENIEYIFIWNEFTELIAALGKSDDKSNVLNKLNAYMDAKKFHHNTFSKIVELRDEFITDLLTIGLNPYYNGMGLPRGTYNLNKIVRENIEEGLVEIQKIKKCIYEGYRFNVYSWNKDRRSYLNNYGHNPITTRSAMVKPVFIDDEVVRPRPKKVIFIDVGLRSGQGELYEFSGSNISVLDGYVSIDDEFLR
jgi:HrpA-like RNA helicase